MAKVWDLVSAFNDDYGEKVAHAGSEVVSSDRVPTGIFALDLTIGGGFPRGKPSLVYGKESSNKTNAVLKAIANHQKIWPDLVCAFVDVENSFDADWAKALGVDIEKLVVVNAMYAEQVVDIVDALLCAEDVGFVALDSIAAMMTINESNSSAEKANVGGNALVVGKMYRKVVKRLADARKEGRLPTFVAINQIRSKIGVMYGNPETMPGGNPPLFASLLILRFYGKDIDDKKVNPDRPCRKETSVIVKKTKVRTVARECKFEMAVIPHNGLSEGDCHDVNTITALLKEYGWLKKDGAKWDLMGEKYPTIKEAMAYVYSDFNTLTSIKKALIDHALERLTDGG